MICAGTARTACQRDPGGPLTCLRNGTAGHKERYLCGIVSRGKDCAKANWKYPGVYTDVSKYTDWIEKFMRTWERHQWSKAHLLFGCDFGISYVVVPTPFFLFLGTASSAPGGGQSDCDAGKFRCPNNALCIPESLRCNGRHDCDPVESWDEKGCTNIACSRGHFQCNSTKLCVPTNYVCDGDEDCSDGSDELDCKHE